MKKEFKLLFVIPFIFILNCTYTTKSILPDSIQKISIPVFKNNTYEYGLEERLTDKVMQEFISHGRLKIAREEEADAGIKGIISTYNLLTIKTDEYDNPIEKELSISLEISFWEKGAKEPLWTEKQIIEKVTFFTTLRSGQIFITVEEAKEKVLKKLAQSIVRRTIIGWY